MRKNIKLEYYRANAVENENMDLLDLGNMLDDLYLRIRQGEVVRYEFNHEIARVADVFFYQDIGCYHLSFERLRDFNLPVKSSFERDSEPIDLEEDEYIGEEVSLLYDIANNVFIIQRNRDSLSPTALEMFLRDIHSGYIGHASNLELNPILRQNVLEQILGSEQVRKINVRIDDLGQETQYEDDLSNITGEISRYEAASLDFTLSVGREKNREMNYGFASRLIENISRRANVSKAQIYVRMDEESNVEKYDLIEHKIHSLVTFDFREERTIRPDAVFQRMRELYIGENNDGMRDRIQRM